VALVCQDLEEIPKWQTREKLKAFPPGLDSLYERMMEQMRNSDHTDLYKQIFACVTTVYRPITLKELASFVNISDGIFNDPVSLGNILERCGSFLTTQERVIYFVHQSAKDFLLRKASKEI
jgi:hypothetical protein